MKSEEIKLPDLRQVEFLSKEIWPWPCPWDPVPWWLKDDIRINILQTQLRYRTELIKLDVQAQEIKGNMLKEIEEILGGQK